MNRGILIIIGSYQCVSCQVFYPKMGELIAKTHELGIDFMFMNNYRMFNDDYKPLPVSLRKLPVYPFIFRTTTKDWQDFMAGDDSKIKKFDIVNAVYNENNGTLIFQKDDKLKGNMYDIDNLIDWLSRTETTLEKEQQKQQ